MRRGLVFVNCSSKTYFALWEKWGSMENKMKQQKTALVYRIVYKKRRKVLIWRQSPSKYSKNRQIPWLLQIFNTLIEQDKQRLSFARGSSLVATKLCLRSSNWVCIVLIYSRSSWQRRSLYWPPTGRYCREAYLSMTLEDLREKRIRYGR